MKIFLWIIGGLVLGYVIGRNIWPTFFGLISGGQTPEQVAVYSNL
jgi:hypothetical protein